DEPSLGQEAAGWSLKPGLEEPGLRYFLSQPDSLSHFAIATLPSAVFSQVEMERVSLLSISLFMQVQYFEMMSTATLAPALSLTQRATHLASSGPADAGAAKASPASTTHAPIASFIERALLVEANNDV